MSARRTNEYQQKEHLALAGSGAASVPPLERVSSPSTKTEKDTSRLFENNIARRNSEYREFAKKGAARERRPRTLFLFSTVKQANTFERCAL